MPGFKAPTLSRVGRSALAAVVALGGFAAGIGRALTVVFAVKTVAHS